MVETSSAQTAIHISVDTRQLKQLRRKLREHDQQLDRFARSWFSAPEALLPNLTAKAEAKERQRELAAEPLRQAEVASQPIDIDAEVEQIAQRVWMLADELSRDKPARLRELMSRLAECVEVSFNEQRRGKKREYRPVGGHILFRGESLGFASRPDYRSFEPLLSEYVEVLLRPDPYVRQFERVMRWCV